MRRRVSWRWLPGLVIGLMLGQMAAMPADLPVAGDTIRGFWRGTLKAGPQTFGLVFEMERDAQGALTAKLHSLDQDALDLAVDEVSLQGGTLKLQVKAIAGAFEGKLSEDGAKLTGQWTQGGESLPLVMTHVEAVPELIRPQEPLKPYPYDTAEVSFAIPGLERKVAGTLTTPRGQGPFPAVMLVPNATSAPDRNSRAHGHRPLLVLADTLTRRGIATLRVDTRGVALTDKNALGTSAERASDALVGIEFLKVQEKIDPHKIGLIGYGEGGLVAPLAAARSTDVAFLVLLAAPGLTGAELMGLQAINLPKAMGLPNSTAIQSLDTQAEIFDIIQSETDESVLEAKLRAVLQREIGNQIGKAANPGKAADDRQALIETLTKNQLQVLMQPWFRFFLTHDPKTTLRKVHCPVLAISGEKDVLVPARENLRAIEQALTEAGNREYLVQTLPGLNHNFQTSETGSPAEFGKIKETFAPAALKIIGDWIAKHTA